MEAEVLDFINLKIREEKGNRVTIKDKLLDADLDSFGITVLFLDLDAEYEYFKDVPENVDPFSIIDYAEITIKEMVDKCILNSMNT